MRLLRRSSVSAALATLVALMTAAEGSRAGGQGTGLPTPDFIDLFDPEFIFDAMNTSQVGAPAPRWVRLDAPATPCTDPQLALDAVGDLTVVDGIGSSDVCIPDYVPGATLAGKIRAASRVTAVSNEGDPNDPFDDFVDRTVELTLTLSVVLPLGGEVQVQSFVVPPRTFRLRTFDNTFLSQPPLVQEVGWFDGRALCSGALILDLTGTQSISVERVAAGGSQGSFAVNGLNRVALVKLGQQQLPNLLCQPDATGACTFTPALVFVEPDGTLSKPANETSSASGVVCDVTLRYARPAGADPAECEAELAETKADLSECQADLASCLEDPPVADGDGDGEADATDRCAGTPAGASVDDAGCSQPQFCAQFDVKNATGRQDCRRADWRNDEPSDWQHDGDCQVAKEAKAKRERCAPKP